MRQLRPGGYLLYLLLCVCVCVVGGDGEAKGGGDICGPQTSLTGFDFKLHIFSSDEGVGSMFHLSLSVFSFRQFLRKCIKGVQVFIAHASLCGGCGVDINLKNNRLCCMCLGENHHDFLPQPPPSPAPLF